jgi:hypothetical protein
MKRALFVITLAVPTFLLKCVDYSDDDEETSVKCAGSTTVIATNYTSTYPFLIDGEALYLQRAALGQTVISRIDKITGDTSTLFTGLNNITLQCHYGAYLYFTGMDYYIHRMSKTGGTVEMVKTFSDVLRRLKVVGDKMYATMWNGDGLFCYSSSRDTITTITGEKVLWFDVDEHSVFWAGAQRDSVTQMRTIWEMKHGGEAPIKRVTDDIGDVRMMDDYICYLSDSTGDLMRLHKDGGEPEILFPYHPIMFSGEDDTYVLVGDTLYVSNCGGGLWKFPARDPVNGAKMIDKWGAFDDDDYTPKLVSDGVALYWFAGPNVNTRISDDDMGVLLKTCMAQ